MSKFVPGNRVMGIINNKLEAGEVCEVTGPERYTVIYDFDRGVIYPQSGEDLVLLGAVGVPVYEAVHQFSRFGTVHRDLTLEKPDIDTVQIGRTGRVIWDD